MQQSDSQKKMSTTAKRDKIFNVRKLPYKQFDNQKYLKCNHSPLLSKDHPDPTNKQNNSLPRTHNMEYHYQIALMSSPIYRELQLKYKQLRDTQKRQKQSRLQALHEKQQQLEKYILERRRLEEENQRLMQKRDQLREVIERLRQQREELRLEQLQRNQQYRLNNMAHLRDQMMGMYYQGGVELDPDTMTYEELLQLEEKIGKVSRGMTEQQYAQLEKLSVDQQHEGETCSICYCNVKHDELIHKLKCGHLFHCECIREWLAKERVCPLCKQEVEVAKGV